MNTRRTISGRVGEPPQGTAYDVPGGLFSERSYLQSRGVLSLDIKTSELRVSNGFRLINETSGSTIVESDQPITAGSEYGSIVDDWQRGAQNLQLRLYLSELLKRDAVNGGKNSLRLVTLRNDDVDGNGEKFAVMEFHLVDFPLFGLTSTFFDSGEQRSAGLQGGFEPYGNSIVSGADGKFFLSTGFMSITNQ